MMQQIPDPVASITRTPSMTYHWYFYRVIKCLLLLLQLSSVVVWGHGVRENLDWKDYTRVFQTVVQVSVQGFAATVQTFRIVIFGLEYSPCITFSLDFWPCTTRLGINMLPRLLGGIVLVGHYTPTVQTAVYSLFWAVCSPS